MYGFTRFGAQPVFGVICDRRVSIRQIALKTHTPYHMIYRAVHGIVRPHPVVVIRICEYLDLTPEDAFEKHMLTGRMRFVPNALLEANTRPELKHKWLKFLESVGWTTGDIRRGYRGMRSS